MPDCRLSIILPAFNREATIGSALTSIGQRIPDDCEIIVVDDGSTDQTSSEAWRALSRMTVKHSQILHRKNAGAGAARNLGAAHAKGRYLVFLDSDDLWCAGTLSTLLTAIDNIPDFALMFFQSVDFKGELAKAKPEVRQEIGVFDSFIKATEAGIQTRFASCNVLIPKPVFDAVSGFDETFPCSEDTDLFLRAGRMAPTAVIFGDPMLAHRVEQTGRLSCDAPKVVQGFRGMIRKRYAGVYGPKQARPLRRFLAGSGVYAVRVAFSQGRVGLAYGTLVRCLPLLARLKPRWVWRLFLTPALAMLRPQSYPFRWRDANPNRTDTWPHIDETYQQARVSRREHWPVG